MDLRQLEYFVAVAEERSFTRGAQRVHIVQSAASAAVARLEAELDVTLMQRSPQGVTLTDAGRIVLLHARRMLGDVQSLHDELQALRGGVTGTIHLGTLFTTGTLDLPGVLTAFRQRHPAVNIELRVTSGAWAEHVRGVRDGSLDLAVVPVGESPVGVEVTPVGSASLILVGSVAESYSRPGEITIDQLRDVPFVDFPKGWGNREMSDRLFASAGVPRNVAIETSSLDGAIALVRAGLGLAFLPEHVLGAHGDLCRVALSPGLPKVPVAVVTASDRTPSAAARALVEQLLEAAAD